MKINELIAQLEFQKSKHGDLECFIWDNKGNNIPVTTTLIVDRYGEDLKLFIESTYFN